ncbi:hypothetical protein SOPP22_18045 [Shewanella sp. OPT22]|nr:hypothetical protein SOPP22_18045 [Shewanella sp. OPT22]
MSESLAVTQYNIHPTYNLTTLSLSQLYSDAKSHSSVTIEFYDPANHGVFQRQCSVAIVKGKLRLTLIEFHTKQTEGKAGSKKRTERRSDFSSPHQLQFKYEIQSEDNELKDAPRSKLKNQNLSQYDDVVSNRGTKTIDLAETSFTDNIEPPKSPLEFPLKPLLKYDLSKSCSLDVHFKNELQALNCRLNEVVQSAIKAVCEDDIDLLQQQIDLGINLNVMSLSGGTLLNLACCYGRNDMLELMIQNGADVNGLNHHGYSPLQLACERNHSGCVLILLKNGVNPKQVFTDGYSSLGRAVRNNDVATASVLLRHGYTETSNTIEKQYSSAMGTAARFDRTECMDLLLQFKFDVNLQDCWGDIPLYSAIRFGSPKSVELLLKRGSKVDILNKDNWSALGITLAFKRSQYAEQLLAHGSDSNQTFPNGHTPLTQAIENGDLETVDLLLRNQASILVVNRYGINPIEYAKNKNQLRILFRLLLEVSSKEQFKCIGTSFVFEIAKYGDAPLLKHLASLGVDFNNVNGEGMTPLIIAALYNQYDNIDELLNHNVNVDAVDVYGCSALHYAAQHSDGKVVDKLLAKKANPTLEDVAGRTPLYEARTQKHSKVEASLQQAIAQKIEEDKFEEYETLDLPSQTETSTQNCASAIFQPQTKNIITPPTKMPTKQEDSSDNWELI